MSCDNSFHDFLSNCESTINVYAKLEASTEYDVVITDKFQKQYKNTYTSSSNGYLQIAVDDWAPGFFTQYSGDFRLEIFTSGNDCKKINFLIAKSYDSIVFNVAGGTREKNDLGCPTVEVGVYGI